MPKGAIAFALALMAIAAFDYGIAYSTYAGICAGPHCPKPSATAITMIPLSFTAAVVAGLVAAATLATVWALILWASFMVPLGIGCFVLAQTFGHSAFALYAVGVMLVLMGSWPLATLLSRAS